MTEIRHFSVGGSSRALTDAQSFWVKDEETCSIDHSVRETMLQEYFYGIIHPRNGNISKHSVEPMTKAPTSKGLLKKSFSSRVQEKFGRSPSASSRVGDSSQAPRVGDQLIRMMRKEDAELHRLTSGAKRAVNGLQFIYKKTDRKDDVMIDPWGQVQSMFHRLASDGFLAREDFGKCIGMKDSEEFAVELFDALARRKKQRIRKINKEDLLDFWLQLADQSFDARLKIFFEMVDSNEDGRITREDIQKLIRLSASANHLRAIKERADEYANLIMEELDHENLDYIELWQLESLLLQRDKYRYSRSGSNVSTTFSTTIGPSENNGRYGRPVKVKMMSRVRRVSGTLRRFVKNNWQRGWIILLWLTVLTFLFVWKFHQYRNRAAFSVMGYCLCTAKGAAETLKFNMALILLPVSKKTLTWLRSTPARLFVPFDDNINFHKMIACAIAVAVIVHAGTHLTCDFPRLVNSSPEKFALIASYFDNKRPSYWDLIKGYEGVTGITMVILLAITFMLATRFRKNFEKLPSPFNRLAAYNAFWYSHHLVILVYVLLIVHGFFVFLVKDWTQKTTWMYLCVPLLLHIVERIVRTWRSEIHSVKIIKVSELPGNVITLVMTKPRGFKYKSGQYIFLQCPAVSKFEWHPFSISSAPGDNFLSVHIDCKGDWTGELRRVFTEGSTPIYTIGLRNFKDDVIHPRRLPKLRVDGPYGAPAQDYRNYDVLLLVGAGIGATPFISILRDLLNNARAATDSNTESSTSADSFTSFVSTSSPQRLNRRPMRVKSAQFHWVTREPESLEWFKGVMEEVADLDHKGLIKMHNHLTGVYEECDARSTLLTLIQALTHAKHGVDILSGTKVQTHFARPKWKDVFANIVKKHPYGTIGVFYCGNPVLAKELKELSHEMSHKTSTRFEFHKEQF